MPSFDVILIIIALVCFALAALKVKPEIEWVPIGLFAFVLTFLPAIK